MLTLMKIENDIATIKEFIKLPTNEYAKVDDDFIKNFIFEFREFIKPLSYENRQEFEKVAKNYKKNLNDLTSASESLLELVRPIYNKKQFENIEKRKKRKLSF